MHDLISGASAFAQQLWHSTSSYPSFISSSSLFFSNPTVIAILLILTLVPLVLWIDSIGKDPASSLNKKMAIKDPSADFKGDIRVNNNPPTKGDLDKVADLTVLDKDRKKYTFKSLYADDENGPRRVLIIFIRHFFCGNCQEYLRILASSITPESLSALSPPTEIVVIGCGQPHLIPMYIQETQCPFPIYADPTRKLYHLFRLTSTWSPGKTPDYSQRSLLSIAVSSIIQELKSGRNMLSGGDFRQVGGEFLFQNGKVTWCHRMRSTRDHAEVPLIRQQLGLDDRPAPQRKRWSAASIGGGITRRLSNRRPMSWAGGSRTKSGNRLERPTSGMDLLQEEDTDKLVSAKNVATGHDMGAQGDDTNVAATNGTVTNGAPTDGSANGAAINGSEKGLNDTINGRAIVE